MFVFGNLLYSLTYSGAYAIFQLDLRRVVVEADRSCALLHRSLVHQHLRQARLTDVAVSKKHNLEHLRPLHIELCVCVCVCACVRVLKCRSTRGGSTRFIAHAKMCRMSNKLCAIKY